MVALGLKNKLNHPYLGRTVLVVALAAFVGVLAFHLLPQANTISGTPRSAAVALAQDGGPDNGVPAEYNLSAGDGVWAYWIEDVPKSECESWHQGCWKLRVFATSRCDMLYVQVNVLDRNRAVIDWTNDLVRDIPAGGRAEMYFANTNRAAAYAQVTEVECV